MITTLAKSQKQLQNGSIIMKNSALLNKLVKFDLGETKGLVKNYSQINKDNIKRSTNEVFSHKSWKATFDLLNKAS